MDQLPDVQFDVVIESIACTFHTICSNNVLSARQTNFWSPQIVDTRAFIHTVARKSKCSLTSMLLAVIYIDRLSAATNSNRVLLSHHTSQRLILAALLCAVKYWEDSYYSNKHYAQIGGVCLRELNTLEMKFLFALDFNLQVEPSDFNKYFGSFNQQCRCPWPYVRQPQHQTPHYVPFLSSTSQMTIPTPEIGTAVAAPETPPLLHSPNSSSDEDSDSCLSPHCQTDSGAGVYAPQDKNKMLLQLTYPYTQGFPFGIPTMPALRFAPERILVGTIPFASASSNHTAASASCLKRKRIAFEDDFLASEPAGPKKVCPEHSASLRSIDLTEPITFQTFSNEHLRNSLPSC